jgi:5-methylcytosine-specific restriction endonuclease McrA
MTTSIRARLREREQYTRKYPRGWKRASKAIRALACGICQRCGQASDSLSVHHIGTPYADGRPGNSRDKHDIRRENLTAICFECHDGLDHLQIVKRKVKSKKQKRRAKFEAHRALGVGTGLVVV